jgi:hypothetical protein
VVGSCHTKLSHSPSPVLTGLASAKLNMRLLVVKVASRSFTNFLFFRMPVPTRFPKNSSLLPRTVRVTVTPVSVWLKSGMVGKGLNKFSVASSISISKKQKRVS